MTDTPPKKHDTPTRKKLSKLKMRLGIDRDYMTAAGYFLMAFSRCEVGMNRAIWAALNLKENRGGHEITTAVRDFGQRMLLLTRLGKALLKTQKNRDDCSSIVRALTFINDDRVNLVHGAFAMWAPDTQTVIYERVTPQRSAINYDYPEISAEYLCDLADYALQIDEALQIFSANVQRKLTLPLPSLDKRPERIALYVQKPRN